MLIFTVITLLLATCVSGQTANYCSSSLCYWGQHIACGTNGSFASTCAPDRTIIPIAPYINTILTRHNQYRNTVAAGNLAGFSPAVRMATMQWDDELSYLAELNVKQCAMVHDQCHNTDQFSWSGQNLASYWGYPAPTPDKAIDYGISYWFNEYEFASMADINSFDPANLAAIGHFTPMVNDRNTRVGCALLRQSKGVYTEYYFACNYAQTNVIGVRVYTAGPAASQCISTNPQYPALCSVNEPIDPNSL